MRIFYLIVFFSFIFSQSWDIDTTCSYIKYVGNHTLHSWEGVSKDINFTLDCENEICSINISTPLEKFDSGNDSRDSNMLYYTESLSYPVVSFQSKGFNFNGQFDKSIDLVGNLNFHGIDEEIPVKIFLSKERDAFWGVCNFSVDLNLFKVDRPSLLMIKISEIIEIESKFKIISK